MSFPPPEHYKSGKFIYWFHLQNEDKTEWWKIRNIETGKEQSCNSKLACEKIIRLAQWLDEKPLNHTTLERKARGLM